MMVTEGNGSWSRPGIHKILAGDEHTDEFVGHSFCLVT